MAETGFLTRTLAWVRKWTDEPSYKKKYTDANVIDLIESNWDLILSDLNRSAQDPIIVRHDFTFAQGTENYLLPPNIGTILRLAKINSTYGIPDWTVTPRSHQNPAGPGISIEGNVLRLEPLWLGDSETLRLEYVPTGDVRLHEGSIAASAITDDTTNHDADIVLAATPSTGSLDTRPNAYVGSVLRILGDAGAGATNDYVQERVIHSYDVTTRTATVKPEFGSSPGAPTGATVTYEIAPLLYQKRDLVLSLAVAMDILTVEGDTRLRAVTDNYNRRMRNLRLSVAQVESILGTRFEHDTEAGNRYFNW